MAHEWTWWTPTRRVAYRIIDWDGNVHVGPTLEADVVFCDVCNALIFVRPVPVTGSYALCPDCFRRVFGITVEHAAEQDGISLTELGL